MRGRTVRSELNAEDAAVTDRQQGDVADLATFDELLESLARWTAELPDWPPARRVRAEWEQIAPRLDRSRRELSRMLVVGVIAWLLTRGSAERPPTKYCFYCGDPVRSDRKHCSHCGTELED